MSCKKQKKYQLLQRILQLMNQTKIKLKKRCLQYICILEFKQGIFSKIFLLPDSTFLFSILILRPSLLSWKFPMFILSDVTITLHPVGKVKCLGVILNASLAFTTLFSAILSISTISVCLPASTQEPSTMHVTSAANVVKI